MDLAGFSAGEWLVLIHYELLLFASLFFFIGALDEFAVDLVWLWLKLRGKIGSFKIVASDTTQPLNGRAAVLIPAWQEEKVLPTTLRHALAVWPQSELTIYVGCYPNDTHTLQAAMASGQGDERLRIVVHEQHGPTSKPDCLNRLYRALVEDERRTGQPFRMVVLHDAEDMVDPAGLSLMDSHLDQADFVQLPVLPVAHPDSRWIASHYCEEFAEAHGKGMVIRDRLNAGLPSAGVGCAVARSYLATLANENDDQQPFDPDSLTEDYELGLAMNRLGARMRFVRARHSNGTLVATRACFPASIAHAVRQKTRWLHGIAFQGWDRLGWSKSPVESWMRLRDRRGPFAAFILAVAYFLLALTGVGLIASAFGLAPPIEVGPFLWVLLLINLSSLLWRAIFRYAFTAREYGIAEGVRAILRIPVANIIAIMAGRRAFIAYVRSLRGHKALWDKTEHTRHPTEFAGRHASA